jgi:hypothetical protein
MSDTLERALLFGEETAEATDIRSTPGVWSVLIRASDTHLASVIRKADYWYAAAHENTMCDVSQIARASSLHAQDHGAKHQNALGATGRKQLTLKHLPISVLNGSVESFSTPSKVTATILHLQESPELPTQIKNGWTRCVATIQEKMGHLESWSAVRFLDV